MKVSRKLSNYHLAQEFILDPARRIQTGCTNPLLAAKAAFWQISVLLMTNCINVIHRWSFGVVLYEIFTVGRCVLKISVH